jgi:hypothetical protein
LARGFDAGQLAAASCGVCITGTNISCCIRMNALTDTHVVHDPDYRAAQKDWASFVESVTQKVVEIDDTIPELPVKDIVRESDSIRQSTYANLPKGFQNI